MIPFLAAIAFSVLVYVVSKMTDKKLALDKIPKDVKRWIPKLKVASDYSGVPLDILIAVLWQESSGQSGVPGSSGEVGLMQVKPGAATDVEDNFSFSTRDYKVDDSVNILTGAYYLALMKEQANTWPEAIRAYNQGFRGKDQNVDKAKRADEYLSKIRKKIDIITV